MTLTELPFLYGAAYYAEYMPATRTGNIAEDFRLMKEAGMNVIRIAESTWSDWEPEDGVFDFRILTEMLDRAEEYGLYVILGTPTYAIPPWLAAKHPDIMTVTAEGPALYGHRQLFDITNPHYLFHAERIIRRMMKAAAAHPAVIGYQLDNETRAADAAGPEIQKKFREWLKKKYGSVEALNEAFGFSYWSNRVNRWADLPDVRGTINGSYSGAYREFLREVITDFLHWQAEIVREYARPDQFLTHNFDFSWKEYSHGIQPLVDQPAAAEALDIAGTDIYHLSRQHFDGMTISFGGAVGRSIKKAPYLVLETQSQGRTAWLPYPGQLRQAAYSHIASGARGVMYWNWHSIHNACEAYWKGVLSHDLTPGRIYREIAGFRREQTPLAERLRLSDIPAKAAILADVQSLAGITEYPFNDGSGPAEDFGYNDVLRWLYDACGRINLPADIIYPGDLLPKSPDSEDASADLSVLTPEKYPLLLVPSLYSASDDTIQALRDYIAQGGHVVFTPRSLFADRALKIRHDVQPYNFTDLAGMHYDEFTLPEDETIRVTLQNETAGSPESTVPDGNIPVNHWMELLIPDTAEIWAEYGNPAWKGYAAVTHNRVSGSFGREGSVTWIGTFFEEKVLQQILRQIMKQAGQPLPELEFPLIRRSGTNSAGEKITFLFNYSAEPRTMIWKDAPSEELLSQKHISTEAELSLKPWDVLILAENS